MSKNEVPPLTAEELLLFREIAEREGSVRRLLDKEPQLSDMVKRREGIITTFQTAKSLIVAVTFLAGSTWGFWLFLDSIFSRLKDGQPPP